MDKEGFVRELTADRIDEFPGQNFTYLCIDVCVLFEDIMSGVTVNEFTKYDII